MFSVRLFLLLQPKGVARDGRKNVETETSIGDGASNQVYHLGMGEKRQVSATRKAGASNNLLAIVRCYAVHRKRGVAMQRFPTSDINLSAFLAANFPVNTLYDASIGKAIFEFDDTVQLRDAIIAYERGAALPAKALLLTRTRLYHEASRVSGRGRV